jgi:hypothetical protein
MKKTKHIAQFDSFKSKEDINESSSILDFGQIICYTNYNGTVLVGMVGNQRDLSTIENMIGEDATKFNYGIETDFVSYDVNGVFELISEGNRFTSGDGYVFPILGDGQFLILNYSGHGSSYEIASTPNDLRKFF